MLSVERCQQVLKELKLSEDVVKELRDSLYLFASIQIEIENNKQQ